MPRLVKKFQYRSLLRPNPKKLINLQPVYECIEPAIACPIRIAEAEAVAAILVKMKLNGPARLKPGVDNTELTAEKKIVCGDHIEHRRSILRHLDGAHATINGTNEI